MTAKEELKLRTSIYRLLYSARATMRKFGRIPTVCFLLSYSPDDGAQVTSIDIAGAILTEPEEVVLIKLSAEARKVNASAALILSEITETDRKGKKGRYAFATLEINGKCESVAMPVYVEHGTRTFDLLQFQQAQDTDKLRILPPSLGVGENV